LSSFTSPLTLMKDRRKPVHDLEVTESILSSCLATEYSPITLEKVRITSVFTKDIKKAPPVVKSLKAGATGGQKAMKVAPSIEAPRS